MAETCQTTIISGIAHVTNTLLPIIVQYYLHYRDVMLGPTLETILWAKASEQLTSERQRNICSHRPRIVAYL